MASYLVANFKITNLEGYKAYTAAVVKTILAHGGKILIAGPGSVAVEGSPDPITVVLEFPTREALQGWYDSAEYQEIIHLRSENTEGSMVFADQFAMPG